MTPLDLMPWHTTKSPNHVQMVFDALCANQELTIDEIAFLTNLRRSQVHEAMRLLRVTGSIRCKRQLPRYSLTDGATRPTDMRGRRCAPKKK